MDEVKKLRYYRRYIKKTLLQVLGLCVIPNFRYSSKCSAQIYRAQYGAAILVYLRGTPIWRPFSSPEPLGFTHHYEWLWLQPKIRIFSLANETQCALGIKLQSTAHFRRVINCNVVVFKNQRVYKRTCFSFEHFERR